MKSPVCLVILWSSLCALAAPPPTTQKTAGDLMLDAYFKSETAKIASRCLADIKTLNDCTSRRAEYRRQLAEMLGLWPEPPRTELKPVVTGKLDHGDFTVEKLYFQSRPGLYVTANLYVPKDLKAPAPAILYVCGHSPVKKNGVALGNKTYYQHHGEWFARNGYVCLIPDSLEFGEIDGIHHGLYRLEMWDWLSRGYTPAGVEAWNGIRCLDYLQSRPEVDPQRIGMTGRSGGGAYTWYTAALDERVKVAVPVAGITDLTNHIVDGTIEGHCDCMFMVNTYRWDFAQVAALIAPRPLLISNSDKDTIFPLDGVVRLHSKVRDIYKLYKADDKLGLLITEGPHKDTQDLQVPAFRWFNRFLKNDTSDLRDALAEAVFKPEELRVFPVHGEPMDSVNMQIQETFIPMAPPPKVPESAEEWAKMRDASMQRLKEKTFRGWPQDLERPEARQTGLQVTGLPDVTFREFEFASQSGVPLHLFVATRDGKRPTSLRVHVLDNTGWRRWLAKLPEATAATASGGPAIRADDKAGAKMNALVEGPDAAMVWFAPRGIGPSAWDGTDKKQTQIRRRFALIGQTLEGMQVWDVRRAIQALRGIEGDLPITLHAEGSISGVALYASLFEPGITRLELRDLPSSHREGTDLLNVLSVIDIPAAVALAAERCSVELSSDAADDSWDYPRAVGAALEWPKQRLTYLPSREK